MISKYGIFCEAVASGSFTKVAEKYGYSQSAVSQSVKSLEHELGATLVSRRRDGIVLTGDGLEYYPYLQAVHNAEKALAGKQKELQGLENAVIRIGTFTSVSRNLLPQIMGSFKKQYPSVRFILQQGEYTSISQWLREGSIDLGFVNKEAVSGLTVHILYKDRMAAVLPLHHPLSAHKVISLRQLAQEPFILLDEGEFSAPLNAFSSLGLSPRLEYKVYDDYSIIAMIRQGLGISIMYQTVLGGFEHGLAVRPLEENICRSVALAWSNWETLPVAARRFARFIMEHTEDMLEIKAAEQ